jgi:hypothetical protein
MMHDEQFTPEELAVIERLRKAPQPQLKPQAVQAIQQLILQELKTPPVAPRPIRPAIPAPLLIGSAMILVAIAILVVVALVISQRKPTDIPPLTSAPSIIASEVPTASAEPESNGSILEATIQPTPTTAPTGQPTAEATVGATADPIDDQTVMVIEGPVQTINVNVITIFGMAIWLDPGDPILAQLQIGKMIHVEGRLDSERNIIVAVNVSVVTVVGPGLPPNCKMSKNGHIKCSKKKK